MRNTTGVYDVPSVPLFPYGNMVQTGLFGTHGTGWDSYFVQTILYTKCPCVSHLSHRPGHPSRTEAHRWDLVDRCKAINKVTDYEI